LSTHLDFLLKSNKNERSLLENFGKFITCYRALFLNWQRMCFPWGTSWGRRKIEHRASSIEHGQLQKSNISLEVVRFSPDEEVIAAAESWLNGQLSDFFLFLSGMQKLEQRAKKCIELRGEYVE